MHFSAPGEINDDEVMMMRWRWWLMTIIQNNTVTYSSVDPWLSEGGDCCLPNKNTWARVSFRHLKILAISVLFYAQNAFAAGPR